MFNSKQGYLLALTPLTPSSVSNLFITMFYDMYGYHGQTHWLAEVSYMYSIRTNLAA